ncbi:hypothetical protein ACHAWF_012503 [Thalassiosira exigua]
MHTPPTTVYKYAVIYYVVHEILRLLKKYEMFLLDYVRWIEDQSILSNDPDNHLAYYHFCKDVIDDFRIL